jgi:hypothetical protein
MPVILWGDGVVTTTTEGTGRHGVGDGGVGMIRLKPKLLCFAFPTATPNRLFFPTLHIHDGQVHDKELFDHTLYFQATRGPLHGGWEESPGLPVTKVKCGLTHGMVRPDMHLYRHQMIGKFTNGDVVVDLPAA